MNSFIYDTSYDKCDERRICEIGHYFDRKQGSREKGMKHRPITAKHYFMETFKCNPVSNNK
jgi:hypothetical protein